MDEITKDDRFAHIAKDARFRRIPKKERKVKIDKRFRSMFNDDRFQVNNALDKRGRPVQLKGRENLEKYYALSSSEDATSDEEKEKEDVFKPKETELKNNLTEDVKKKLKDLTVDYARGEGRILSDSSSDEESEEEERSNKDEFEHAWGEMDRNAETTEEATARLALCNMDWDRISAADLMVLFHSFLPASGVIKSVTIYPSEFGLKRMAEEEMQGPSELNELTVTGDEESEELNRVQMEKLREYQLKRLKYFYAVISFDSAETANHIYTECDGLEYESSMNRLDLRFVPEDTTFDQAPRESCTELPDIQTYKPHLYNTTALSQVKVDLTWDETDPNRQEVIKAVHTGSEDHRLKKYLASSSSSSSSEEEEEAKDEEGDDCKSEASRIEKYKTLLLNIANEENKKKQEVSMEISWDLQLEQKVKESVEKKTQLEKTPFEQYLEKKKIKKQQKKEARKEKTEKQSDELVEAFSDDDLPSDIDLNDPYFKEEFGDIEKKEKTKKEKGKKKLTDNPEDEQNKAELELLLMDEANEDQSKHHFSLKQLEESEKPSKSKKKSLKRKNIEAKKGDDNFKMDVNDERFSAIYTSHLFNVDPADPQFKRTKGMKDLIEEKQRRVQAKSTEPERKISKTQPGSKLGAELSVLVKSVKRKTENIKKVKG